jgi:branched-chain amino acid transport system permease protein
MPLPDSALARNYGQELAIFKTTFQKGILAVLFVLIILLPQFPFVSDYWMRIVINFSITIIAVLGLNILTGLCGQGSIAQAAFMAVGAYLSVILTGRCGLPFWIALPCAGVFAGSLGTSFGLSALKVRGLYLFLVTLGAHFIIEYAIIHIPGLTGGQTGISVSPPKLMGYAFRSLRSYYYIVIIFLTIALCVAKNLMRTHIGRAWMAIRDKDMVAKAMGINVYHYKLLAFFVGCAYAGVAGSLWAHSKSWLAPEDFSLMQACWFLGMIIVGGLGTVSGSILGTILLLGLGEITTYAGPAIGKVFPALSMGIFAASSQLIYSLIILLFLAFEPGGLINLWYRVRLSFKPVTL